MTTLAASSPLMTTLAASDTPPVSVVKFVMVSPDNPRIGLPSINGSIMLHDSRTGALRAVLDAGNQAFLGSGCIACHRIEGTVAAGVLGPDLTHVGSRRTIAAGILENTPENLERWIRNPAAVKPGVLMPTMSLDEDTIRTLVAYLESLK